MKEFKISKKEAGQRMDKYLFKVLDRAPRSFVYKMLRKKNIVLNEKKAAGQEILEPGDEIRIYLADETFAKFASRCRRPGKQVFRREKGKPQLQTGIAKKLFPFV